MNLAPIVLFVYNRPWHTRQTLEALAKNTQARESKLYVFADGPRGAASKEELAKIAEVRQLVQERNWCGEQELIVRERNWGLADNIVDGVTKIVNQHGRVIVLEDDIVTSHGFLKYMNDALELYELEEKVLHVSGYMFPVTKKLPSSFFYNTASCWGWATWKRAWKQADFNAGNLLSKIQSPLEIEKFNINGTYPFYKHLQLNAKGEMKTWAVRWYANVFIHKGFSLHPYPSLANNIGHDGFGEHCGVSTVYDWPELAEQIELKKIPLKENPDALKGMETFYTSLIGKKGNNKRRILAKIKRKSFKALPSAIQARLSEKAGRTIKEAKELERLKELSRYEPGKTDLFGKTVTFADGPSFYFMYQEIFKNEVYKFNSVNKEPLIIDGGANIGLSVIYFKHLYAGARVVAFEADPAIAGILEQNTRNLQLSDVEVKAVGLWSKDGTLKFQSEKADAGRIDETAEDAKEIRVQRLRHYLDQPVDYLKLDIEGAELAVLEDSRDLLPNVKRMFVEYHNFIGKEQSLDRILAILKESGFRYYISNPGLSSGNPLVKKRNYLGMDFQLNIHAERL